MNCPICASHILDDCLYCPKCGKPTPLSAERSAASLPSPVSAPEAKPGVAATILSSSSDNAVSLSEPERRALENRLTQANLSRVRGNWNEAIDHCVAVLQADPANASAHALLGDIYADRGRNADAVQWYRMALDLQPNPAVNVKLSRVEIALEQQAAKQAWISPRAAAGTLPPGAETQVGTVALMGVSPRLWLRGITVLSVAFLLVTGGILLGTQNRRVHQSLVPNALGDPNQVNSIAPLPGSEGVLPPARPGGPTVVPGAQASNTSSAPHEGGGGLSPDAPTQSRTVPVAFPNTAPSRPSPGRTTAAPNIPTASVRDVRPMPHSAGSEPPAYATLSGGMKLAKMTSLTNSDEAVLVLSDAPASGQQEHFRQDAIRNVYRAARNAFATNTTATEASVYIQTDLTEKGGAVLLSAHLDRDTALKSDPESDQTDSLLNRLRSVQWGQ